MDNTTRTMAGLLACTLSLGAPFLSGAAVLGGAADEVTLKGCLVKGEGDGAGYLLTNTPAEPGWQRSEAARIAPDAVGTTGGFESIFYWLDGDNDLKTNIGHRVELTGDLEGDLKDGEITLARKDRWTALTVKADGRTMKANVPNPSLFAAPGGDKDRKARVLVRRVDVEQVKMLAATCEDTAR